MNDHPAAKGLSAQARAHIRGHIVGYVALFVALSGVAYADDGPLAGTNTVGSSDIINGEVQTQDIQAAAVGSARVADDSLTADDLANHSVDFGELDRGAFLASDIAPVASGLDIGYGIPANSIQGAEIESNTIGRSDLAASAEAPAGFSIGILDTGIICNEGCREGTLALPPGTYATFGKIRLNQQDFDDENSLRVQCTLGSAGEAFDTAVFNAGDISLDATLNMQGVRTINSGDDGVSINCRDYDTGDVKGLDLQIMAIRLGTLN